MMPQSITDALELGLFGLVLVIVTAPLWVAIWAWRALSRDEY